MPSIILRICHFYNIIYSIFLYLLPKKLKHYFSQSYNQIQQPINDAKSTISQPPMQPRSGRMDQNELMRIFQMFDKNGDGRITKQELNDSLENMNIYICDNDLMNLVSCIKVLWMIAKMRRDMRRLLMYVDINGDGVLCRGVRQLRGQFSGIFLGSGSKARKAEDCRQNDHESLNVDG
ncbi:calcium-binding EF-hand family protein [Artemisia annua]|uniref:Calcium-binding EF-hand family protein n=1 Tax=Artemisia annua TaxID=35608 RepID=A0A2U1LBK1_ARTAN|nr:calcium-binding EF-hand family protein [Artemisia annua]